MFKFFTKRIKKREMEKKGLIGSRKLRTQEATLGHSVDRSKAFGLLILTLVWGVSVFFLLIPQSVNFSSALVIGEPAKESIFSEFNFQYKDKSETRIRRLKARNSVPLYFQINPKITEQCISRLEQFIDAIKTANLKLHGVEVVDSGKKNEFSEYVKGLDKQDIADIIDLIRQTRGADTLLKQIEVALNRGILPLATKESSKWGAIIRIKDSQGRVHGARAINKVLTAEDIQKVIIDKVLMTVSPRVKDRLRKNLGMALNRILLGNLELDKVTTNKERDIAAAQTPEVIRNISIGENLVIKNQKVTKDQYLKVKKYEQLFNARQISINLYTKLIRYGILSLLFMLVIGLYIYHIHPEVVRSNQKMWLIGTTVILSILINYLFLEFYAYIKPMLQVDIPKVLLPMILPVAFSSVILSVLVGLRVAVFAGLYVALITAATFGNAFEVVVQGLVATCLAGVTVRYSTNHRTYFLRIVVVVTIILIPFSISQFWDAINLLSYWKMILVLSIGNGLLTAFLALLFLSIFESLFKVTSDMSLLILCDYNHPLLKRLQLEAPGSYHHSLMVATLAEQAARDINANPIKVRACALFHDIGKLVKPEYFTENAVDGENKHKDLHPRMSALIILSHVKEGIDIALKFKLRKIIRDAIEQHHGTDLIYFFYRQAQEEATLKNMTVEEQAYRYPGPLPKDKEIVLISLADACEAASRSLVKPSPAKVDALVWEILKKRIRNGQLDEADLTFGEISKVRKSFVKTLTTMLHGRIAYPKDENEEDEDDLFMAAKRLASSKKSNAEQADSKS